MDDGTTALCVLAHGDKNLTIANAGDSRAVVIKKSGQALPLSFDHKPDRSDERERYFSVIVVLLLIHRRISSLGGSVVHWGVWRVEGKGSIVILCAVLNVIRCARGFQSHRRSNAQRLCNS